MLKKREEHMTTELIEDKEKIQEIIEKKIKNKKKIF